MIKKICQQCGEEFSSYAFLDRKYCSPECYYAVLRGEPSVAPQQFAKCKMCGKDIPKENKERICFICWHKNKFHY